MSRYLTAAKVAYLTLIHLYCDNAVPDSAALDFLSLTVSLTSGFDSQDAYNDDSRAFAAESLLISTITDLEQRPALKLPSTIPGRSIYELFVRKLWMIDSLDALHEHINTSDALFQPPGQVGANADTSFTSASSTRTIVLGQRSPLGVFVRRIRLEFTRLQFSDAIQLWLAFIKFRTPSQKAWQRLNRDSPAFDRVLQDLQLDPGSDLARIAYRELEEDLNGQPVASATDVERLLEFQLDKLQRFGGRVPPETYAQLKEMTSKLRSTPSLTHFLSFFDAWRAGDYHTSFDSLHRYFDHTLQARDKTHYQYALLHMAILHADFGCFSEAVAAMNEAVATARENQDIVCLNFSLNWLNHLRKAHPQEMRKAGWPGALGESERDGLVFLKSKAREMKMWALLSSAMLSEARLDLTGGESISRVFEHIYQSSHILTNHNITQNAGAQLSLQSAVYARMGCGPLSSAHNDLITACYARLVPQDDVVRAACRTASIFAAGGSYNEAAAILRSAQGLDRQSLKMQQFIATRLHMVSLARAIRRSDIPAARLAIATLKPLASTDAELGFDFHVLHHRHEADLGNTGNASTVLETLTNDCKPDDTDIHHRLTTALLKARMYAQAGIPQKGFTIALRAAAAAQKAGIMPILWEAVSLLCETLMELHEFDAARALLDAILPAAHEGGDSELLARLYAGLADACVGIMGQKKNDAGRDPEEQRDRLPGMSRAELFLDRAERYYQKIEDWDEVISVMAKKALLARMRGDMPLANSLAKKVADFEADAG